jgi:hypothetical protein
MVPRAGFPFHTLFGALNAMTDGVADEMGHRFRNNVQ